MAGQGNKIIATDFNTIQAKINLALGIGTGDYGYGQVVTSAQVSLENKIEASQWNALRNDLLKARQHQTGLNESGNLALPTTSATIKEADRSAYNNFADVITTNRLITPPASQGSLATLGTVNRTTPWNSTVSQTITCTFSSIDAARYFFNTGSNLKFSASFKDYTTDGSLLVNQSWDTLLTNMGIISVSANTTTKTGTGTEQNIGYYNLTSTNQLVFSKSVESSNPSYFPNQYELYARLGTTAAQVIFTPTFSYTGGPVGPGTGVVPEPANGTLTSILQTYYATGSNVAVAPPTVTAGALIGGVPTPPVPVISYVVTPASLSVNEGASAVFNVTGTNIPNGTYYWTTGNNTTSNADFSTNSGSFTITSNFGSFSVTATNDLTSEGVETFFVTIRSGSISGPALADSADALVTINDTSTTPPAPTLAISPTTLTYASIVNNVPSTQRITFTSTNGAVTVDSVSTVGATSNSVVTIDYTGATGSPSTGAPFTVNGTKYIDVSYYLTSGTSGSATLSASTTDGSKSATLAWSATPSYAVSPATSNVNEGSSLTFTVTTTSVTNGTVLNWAINTNTGDFGTSSGTVTINSNTGTFTVTPTADSTTEGAETFSVSIYTGSISGSPVATSSSVTINDTSTTPPPPATYTLTPASSNVSEGSSLTFIVGGTNIVNGTYYWTVTNTGDFGTSSGSFTITSNSGSFSVSPTADSSTEGSETFIAAIWSGFAGGTLLATSSSVTINDTSTTPPPPPPQLNASPPQGPLFDYVIFGPNISTKAYHVQIYNSGGPFTPQTPVQNWSIFTIPSLTIQTGFGNGTSSGTFSGSITNAVVGWVGPHSAATAFITVSAPGFTSYNTTIAIPANSVYTPYTYSSGFLQESGTSNWPLAQQIGEGYYRGSGAFTAPALSPPTRYGFNRQPEYAGLFYWTTQAIANGWSYDSAAFNNTIFGAAQNAGIPSTSPNPFQFATGYGNLMDRP